MDFPPLSTFSFPSFVHDALIVVGLSAVLLAALVFINLGVLLLGLLTSLGGRHGDPRDQYVETGPAAAPLISEPAPPRATSPETNPDPHVVARPHLWHHVSGGGTIQLTAPSDGGTR